MKTPRPKFEFENTPMSIMEELNENDVDRIAESFVGQTIFITGASGFLGKVLIEKLLRSCGGLTKIYVLIRPRRGKTPGERIKDMFANVLYDTLKQMRGEDALIKQVGIIHGDLLLPGLGISDENMEILRNEVTLVYHCAATVRFDEPFRRAVFMNVRGTKYMLELAATLKKLKLFVHISTAYCNLHIKKLLEKPYDPPANPHKVIQACEWLTDEQMKMIEKHVLGDIPNTYAYTKSLAEALIVEQLNVLPVTILRPSIVVPIWREPYKGWTDNINGPIGILIGAGKGVIRTMYCKSTGFGDFLPVDLVVNGMLVSSWHWLTTGLTDSPRVIHLTNSNELKVTWSELIMLGRWIIENKVPLNNVAWYPGGSMKSNRIVHYICMGLFHWVPAILADALLMLFRYPPILCRIQDRITKGFTMFEYYANNEWDFDNSEGLKLRKLMNSRERRNYVIEKVDVDLIDYFTHCTISARRLILKEPDSTIPAAKRHMRIMWCVDKTVKLLFLAGVSYMVYNSFFSSSESSTTHVEPIGAL